MFEYFYICIGCCVYCLVIVNCYVVEKIEIVMFQCLYNFLYIEQVGSYCVVYVVIKFNGIWYVVYCFVDNVFDFIVVYIWLQCIFFQWLFV